MRTSVDIIDTEPIHLCIAEGTFDALGIRYNVLNNNMNNLEWVTNQENRNHAIKNNLTKNLCGEEAPWSKLTKKDVIFIRSEYDKKETFNAKKLSKKFKVSTSQILLVAKRKSWKSV